MVESKTLRAYELALPMKHITAAAGSRQWSCPRRRRQEVLQELYALDDDGRRNATPVPNFA